MDINDQEGLPLRKIFESNELLVTIQTTIKTIERMNVEMVSK